MRGDSVGRTANRGSIVSPGTCNVLVTPSYMQFPDQTQDSRESSIQRLHRVVTVRRIGTRVSTMCTSPERSVPFCVHPASLGRELRSDRLVHFVGHALSLVRGGLTRDLQHSPIRLLQARGSGSVYEEASCLRFGKRIDWRRMDTDATRIREPFALSVSIRGQSYPALNQRKSWNRRGLGSMV